MARELIECPRCKEMLEVPVRSQQAKPSQPVPVSLKVPPMIPSPRKPFPFRAITKWIVIGWTAFCGLGLGFGLFTMTVEEARHPTLGSSDQFESAGAFLGFGFGLFIWFIIWAIVAVPAGLIWLVTKKE
jgi:hypothetical protein